MGEFSSPLKVRVDGSGESEEPDFDSDFGSPDSFGVDASVVMQAQARLNTLGFGPLTPDGKWGPLSQATLRKFQASKGLKADGLLGPQSIQALGLGVVAPSRPPSVTGPAAVGDFTPLVTFAQKNGQRVVQGSGIAPGFQATRASVVNSFVSWSTPLEGYTDYPYTDAEGLVTTAMGNLIDAMAAGQQMHVNCGHGTSTPCGQAAPTGTARALPWSGSIDADWAKLKAAWPGKQSTACKGITSARLAPAAAASLIQSRMKANETFILSHFPNFAQAPADAQLAIHSMAWAMGPAFTSTWTLFDHAFLSGDYAEAAAQSHMKGVGIDMRNLANKLLLLNAAAVKATGASADRLYYLDGLSLLTGGSKLALGIPAALLGVKSETLLRVGVWVIGGAIVGGVVFWPWGVFAGAILGGTIDLAIQKRG